MPSFINGLKINDNGRADVELNGPAPGSPGFMAGRSYDGDLLQIQNAGPTPPLATCGGFLYDANGDLLVTTTTGIGVNYRNGLKFTDAGLLYCTPVSPIANYVHGWPVSGAGELCIN